MAEPGRFFVEMGFAAAFKIYSTKVNKVTGMREYFIGEGVEDMFKDAVLCDENFEPMPLRVGLFDPITGEKSVTNYFDPGSCEVFPSMLRGPSGNSDDIVNKHCMLPALKNGDWLVFDRVGAYTISIASRGDKNILYMVGEGGD